MCEGQPAWSIRSVCDQAAIWIKNEIVSNCLNLDLDLLDGVCLYSHLTLKWHIVWEQTTAMQMPFPVLRQTLFDAGEGGRDVMDSLDTSVC